MKVLRRFLYILTIVPFFLGNNANAMNDDQTEKSPPNKGGSGLHRPTKQPPAGFIKVDPLGEAHVDEDGRTYYIKSVPSLTPNTPPIPAK